MSADISNDNFVVLQGFAVKELHLKGNELIIYSIIYGFSQAKDSWFTGSASYLSDWTNTSTNCVYDTLKKLIDKKLIEKKEVFRNDVKYCEYRALRNKTSNNPTFEEKRNIEPNRGQLEQIKNDVQPINENNEAFKAWEDEMGVRINKNIKFNRYACNRLVKKYGLDNVIKFIKLAKYGLNERYCPNCYNFIDLEQKLPALLAFGKDKFETRTTKNKNMMTMEDL